MFVINLPEDLVPYWDYDAHDNEPRDARLPLTASALYELASFGEDGLR